MKKTITEKRWTERYRARLVGRHVQHGNHRAIIVGTLSYPGSVELSKALDGFRYWNLDDLTFVPQEETS